MTLELIQITNDPALASALDGLAPELGPLRLMVDMESMGKAQRQAGRNTFISAHQWDDVARLRRAAPGLPLMVRLNPWHADTPQEIDRAIDGGADRLMLPMFADAATLAGFCEAVAGRLPVTALLETAGALTSLHEWVRQPGLSEVFVGLNDLHLSLGLPFMFLPLADGTVADVAATVQQAGHRFGFGGIARMDEGLLPGRAVLAEHVRLGSSSVILSRTFHRFANDAERMLALPTFALELRRLRAAEHGLRARAEAQRQADRARAQALIGQIADALRPRAPS
jgi:2-keto-3-deoxy-L-rhamnonate aldolase RhmA